MSAEGRVSLTSLLGTHYSSFIMVGRQGFEPWKPMATDLQSAPFGHLGTCPKLLHTTQQISQDAEKVRQRRSRFAQKLNVPKRTPSPLRSLRPCWTAFLIILRGVLLLF